MKMNDTELALKTWYKPNNPLYKNPEHPTIKLAGEIGELMDLWGKHKYKPEFDWMNCKHCGSKKSDHNSFRKQRCWQDQDLELEELPISRTFYTSIVLDELGDIWYYLRILAWIYDVELKEYIGVSSAILGQIKSMYCSASTILINDSKISIPEELKEIYCNLIDILENLNITIEELTELNYIKLNSDPTNHGWKDAQ